MTGFGNGERDNCVQAIHCCPGAIIEVRDNNEVGRCKKCGRPVFVGFTLDPPPETVTAEAERLTQAARHHQYGPPHLDFAKVTGMAKALWGRGPETPVEHALYMILVKISRLENSYDRDSIVDICGYARTIEMIAEREEGLERLAKGREKRLAERESGTV